MAPYTGLVMGATNNQGLWDSYNKYQNDYYAKQGDRGDLQSWNQFSGINDFMNKHSNDPGMLGASNAGIFNLPKDKWESYLQGHNSGYTQIPAGQVNAGQFRMFDPQKDNPNLRFGQTPPAQTTFPQANFGVGSGYSGAAGLTQTYNPPTPTTSTITPNTSTPATTPPPIQTPGIQANMASPSSNIQNQAIQKKSQPMQQSNQSGIMNSYRGSNRMNRPPRLRVSSNRMMR